MPIVPLAGVERQPVTHRGERLRAPGKDLREQTLRADVALLVVGAVAPRDHLGPRELVVEEITSFS